MPHKEIIEDICTDCRNGGGYCTLKEIVLHSGIPDRTLEQLKLVEMLKWDMSEKEGRDVGWQPAWDNFIQNYASIFSEIYQDGMKGKELYELVIKGGYKANAQTEERK